MENQNSNSQAQVLTSTIYKTPRWAWGVIVVLILLLVGGGFFMRHHYNRKICICSDSLHKQIRKLNKEITKKNTVLTTTKSKFTADSTSLQQEYNNKEIFRDISKEIDGKIGVALFKAKIPFFGLDIPNISYWFTNQGDYTMDLEGISFRLQQIFGKDLYVYLKANFIKSVATYQKVFNSESECIASAQERLLIKAVDTTFFPYYLGDLPLKKYIPEYKKFYKIQTTGKEQGVWQHPGWKPWKKEFIKKFPEVDSTTIKNGYKYWLSAFKMGPAAAKAIVQMTRKINKNAVAQKATAKKNE